MGDASDDERAADALAARGDTQGAQRRLERALAADPGRPDTWLKLAAICRARGDIAAALAAVEAGLRHDPLHFMLLLSRGTLLQAAGRDDEAARFYLRALAQLPAETALPAALRATVERARSFADAYRDRIAGNWRTLVADLPGLDAPAHARIARFTSNALRQTRVYHSEPTHYHYPGLVEAEFHERSLFPWLADLEAATGTIRDEYLALVERDAAGGEPYVQYAADLPIGQWAALNHSLDWTAFHLLRNGTRVEGNAAVCPATLKTLSPVAQPRVTGQSPNAMFSLLKPRTHIPPHTGVANTRLVCHLPLIVPDGCWFRVGAERRQWRIGEAFVFDDTIEHEAANDSDAPRVVLIFDLWHHGLNDAERRAITTLMESDESGEGVPV